MCQVFGSGTVEKGIRFVLFFEIKRSETNVDGRETGRFGQFLEFRTFQH